ncbi:PEP-CTERM sorting domain-containing protein [Cyanobacterium aponinum]|uniref:PEP-CTERM sorting domain-containing protein n=1 Tax=Cyanobacterium aponinum TaxID=379064 RepID=UPI001F4E4F83|nr:PEP-CTERM sorting domain-containing protein [Cyanobacterium aponinum]
MNNNKILMTISGSTGLLIGSLIYTSSVSAFTLNFVNKSNNNPSQVDVASQLSVDVSENGDGKIVFNLKNEGSITSKINQVYFGKQPNFSNLLTFFDFGNKEEIDGVDFVQGSSPPNPQGGINWVDDFSAQRDTPQPQKKAIANGESLEFIFNLASGKSFDDVLNGFSSDPTTLAIGLHVQGIGDSGKSDWFETTQFTPPQPVPEPLTILGTGLALGLGGLFKSKQKQKLEA